MVNYNNFSMKIWFSDQFPSPWWILSLTSSVGVIVCGTYFDMFSRFYESLDYWDKMLIVECLYIDHEIFLSLIEQILDFGTSIEWWYDDMSWDFRYFFVSHMRIIWYEYLFEKSESTIVSWTIDIFPIFLKEGCCPIACRDRISIIDNPEFRMSKRISVIISIDETDSCILELFGYWHIDAWCTEYIPLEYNPYIDSSFFCLYDWICELRSISPCIYLNPDTTFCILYRFYDIVLGICIREWFDSTSWCKYLLCYFDYIRRKLRVLTKKMLMIWAWAATNYQKQDDNIYFQLKQKSTYW